MVSAELVHHPDTVKLYASDFGMDYSSLRRKNKGAHRHNGWGHLPLNIHEDSYNLVTACYDSGLTSSAPVPRIKV